jgi:hypothetical protein
MGISPLHALVAWMPIPPTGLSADVTDRDKDLVSRVQPQNPWCGGNARFTLTLTNAGSRRLWITLEEPAEERIEPLHYSYSYDLHVEVVGGVACWGGDGPLAYLRGSSAASLAPGQSKTWKVSLRNLNFHQGKGTVEMTIDLVGTRDRESDQLDAFVFTHVTYVSLRRTGRCFRATRRSAG